ncbi:MAG: MBL fold metallo-hydrolase [Christensenellaceae bacterium]|nr:MBL fold metallo-hydrolase [Christensenellaceae bacterium]
MKIFMAPLISGSSGNATLIGTENTRILIDAGSTGKVILGLLDGLGAGMPEAILVTHEHTDHINAVGVISRKLGIPVFANAETWEAMQKKIGNISLKNIRIIEESEFYIGDICVKPFETSHDAAHPFAYSCYANGAKVSTLTDTGRFTKKMLKETEGADIVLLEANHDIGMLMNGSYPKTLKDRIRSTKGHLSNDQAAEAARLLADTRVRGLLLGHLSRENNTLEAAFGTVKAGLKTAGIDVGKDIGLGMTKRDCAVGPYLIGD